MRVVGRVFLIHSVVALSAAALPWGAVEAVVGNAEIIADANARPEVILVGSRGNFCTGVAIAPDLVLTAAHCVLPGAEYKRLIFDAQRKPILRGTLSVTRHPQFNLQAMLAHRATADVALVKLAEPLAARPARLIGARTRVTVGERFTMHGYGMGARGDGTSSAILRRATLVATGKPGNLQLRLVDPTTNGARPGLGACTGDSGAPIYDDADARSVVFGVVSWSTGPGGSDGCGGLTGVTPLELYRKWIIDTARKLGSPLLL